MRENKFESFKDQLQKTLILYLLIPIIFIAVISYGTIYFLEYRTIKNENIKNTKILAKNLDNMIKEYFNEIDKISRDKEIINAIRIGKFDNEIYKKIYDSINSIDVRGNFIIYDKHLHIKMSSAKFIGSENEYNWGFFNRMISHPNDIILKINRLHFQDQTSSVFSVGKILRKNNEVIGYVVYNILDNSLREIIGKSGSFNVIITDKYNNIAVTTNESFRNKFGKIEKNLKNSLGYSVINKEKYYINRKEIYYSNILLYTVSTTSYIINNFIEGLIYMTVFFIIIWISMYFTAKIIAEKKTKTIKEIVYAIENIKTGDLDTQLCVNSNDEFQIIADSYNKMLLNIKELIALNKEEAKHSTVLEIKQLESQFNPHFLFNTLEMLKYTIKSDILMADKIIVNISSLLRFSIENKSSQVSLERDIIYTKNYLDIQKYRFGENFDYKIIINKELKNFYIPKLIIQPIIENAIKHGYTQTEKMEIYIKAKKWKDKLLITVYNNGKGMTRYTLIEIRERLKIKGIEIKEHIGIYNIFRRIQLMYGKEYGLRILSSKKRGTSVRITLPLKYGDE